MNYKELKENIINILHSAQNEYTLKLYDNDGNSTLDTENVQWIYVSNDEILFQMPDEMNRSVIMWKNNSSGEDITKILKKIRKQCMFNGVTFNIKLYNNLDRQKLHNIIKNSIIKSKSEKKKMAENSNKSLSSKLFEGVSIIKNTRKPSDAYISKNIISKNISGLFEGAMNVISSIDELNNNRIKNLFKNIMKESAINNVDKIVKCFETKCPEEYKALEKNIDTIMSAIKFSKNRYLENYESVRHPHTSIVLENIIVYPIKEHIEKENLIKAYNHLVSVSSDAKNGIDILRLIKNNKLCETYKVSKDDLLDVWMSKGLNEIVKPKTLIVFESVNGTKNIFDMEMKPSISNLAEHFNENGNKKDLLAEQIIDETIKLNSLKDLVLNHYYNDGIKKYAKTITELCKESLERLNKNDFSNNDTTIDYSKELALIENATGLNHNGFKYIAIREAIKNKEKQDGILLEQAIDKKVLKDCFVKFMSFKEANNISSGIVNTKLSVIKPIKEGNAMDTINQLTDNVFSADKVITENVNNCLKAIILYPNLLSKNKDKFVRTLKKYII